MEEFTTVKILDLPPSIQKKLPYSIRTYKDEYEIKDLPPQIQYLIQDYLKKKKDIKYNLVFDVRPDISEYGDFTTIDNVQDVVIEYIKNYFLTLPYDYPFEPGFGSTLKQNLHTKDTQLRQKLISAEVDSVVSFIGKEFTIPVSVVSVDIQNLNRGDSVEYNVIITIKVNDTIANINFTS